MRGLARKLLAGIFLGYLIVATSLATDTLPEGERFEQLLLASAGSSSLRTTAELCVSTNRAIPGSLNGTVTPGYSIAMVFSGSCSRIAPLATRVETLSRLASHSAFWFGWYGAYPKTRLLYE